MFKIVFNPLTGTFDFVSVEPVPSLDQVLLIGNSVGLTNIDLNNQDIVNVPDSGGYYTATTLVGMLQELGLTVLDFVKGPTPAASTDKAIARWDSTSGRLIQNSTAILSDTGDLSGIANLTVTGTTTLNTSLSGVLKATAGVVSGSATLSDITSLPITIAQGGTNSSTALNNNRIMISSSGAIVEASAITANRALISDSNGIPIASSVTSTELGYVSGVTSAIQTQLDTKAVGVASAVDSEIVLFSGTGGKQLKRATGTGVVHVTSGVYSVSNVVLTSEVSGILPIANGGTNSSTALNNNRIMISSSGAIVEHSALTGSRALVTNSSGLPAVSATTATEIGYLSGVTSAVQTQLDAKAIGVASAVDSEIVLFSGTGGKQLKRATGTGVVHATSGVYSVSNVVLTSEVSGILPIANGGTNSSTALNNLRLMKSASGAIVESSIQCSASDDIITTNEIYLKQDNKKLYFGIDNDAYITFDGNSLNIKANAVTASDIIELQSKTYCLGDFALASNQKLLFNTLSGNTYLIYNASSSDLDLYVDSTKVVNFDNDYCDYFLPIYATLSNKNCALKLYLSTSVDAQVINADLLLTQNITSACYNIGVNFNIFDASYYTYISTTLYTRLFAVSSVYGGSRFWNSTAAGGAIVAGADDITGCLCACYPETYYSIGYGKTAYAYMRSGEFNLTAHDYLITGTLNKTYYGSTNLVSPGLASDVGTTLNAECYGVDITLEPYKILEDGIINVKCYGLALKIQGDTDIGYGIYIENLSGSSAVYSIYDKSYGPWLLKQDNKKLYFGAAQDAYIQFTGTNLQIVANAVVSTDYIYLNSPTRIGSASDYSSFETDGTLVFVGNATVWDDIRIAGLSVKTGSSAPDLISFTGSGGLLVYGFDGGSITEQVYFTVQIPHSYREGTNIIPHIHWAPVNNNSGNVKWFLEYTWQNIDGTFSTPTTISVAQAASGTAWKHQVAYFSAITGTGKTMSSMLVCRLYRDPTDSQDTYGSDAAFLEFDFHFEQDTVGSRQATTK